MPSTTSRSWATGARISSVMRRPPGQNSRSPSTIRRSSLMVRLLMGTSRFTMTATSLDVWPRPALGHTRPIATTMVPEAMHRITLGIEGSEGKRDLKIPTGHPWLADCLLEYTFLRLDCNVVRDVVPNAKRGCVEVQDDASKRGIIRIDAVVLESIVGLEETSGTRESIRTLYVIREAGLCVRVANRRMADVGDFCEDFGILVQPHDVRGHDLFVVLGLPGDADAIEIRRSAHLET